MQVSVRALALWVALLATAQIGWAGCDPSIEPDSTDVRNARAAVAATCDCGGDRHTYLSCATATAHATLTNQGCTHVVRRCASRSTCGRQGAFTCCRTRSSGKIACTVKRDPAPCTAPRGGTACVGSAPSCCDACPDGACSTTTTTTQPTPCGPDGGGSCAGSCLDPSDTCEQDTQTGQCTCVPGPCHAFGGIGSCRGTCAAGGTCTACAACGGCGCVIPCNGGTVPECTDGTCPAGYVCAYDGIDPACLCRPAS